MITFSGLLMSQVLPAPPLEPLEPLEPLDPLEPLEPLDPLEEPLDPLDDEVDASFPESLPASVVLPLEELVFDGGGSFAPPWSPPPGSVAFDSELSTIGSVGASAQAKSRATRESEAVAETTNERMRRR